MPSVLSFLRVLRRDERRFVADADTGIAAAAYSNASSPWRRSVDGMAHRHRVETVLG
jgi:hypothetical protein